MTVVHSSATGTARAQAKTVGAGVLRASSDSTLVSSRITAGVRQTPYSGPEKSGGGRLPRSRTSWKSCPPSGAKMARMASASVSVAEPGGAADLNLSKRIQRASSASDRPWPAASARKRARVSSSRSGITRVLTTTRLLIDVPRCGTPSCCQTMRLPLGATGEWPPRHRSGSCHSDANCDNWPVYPGQAAPGVRRRPCPFLADRVCLDPGHWANRPGWVTRNRAILAICSDSGKPN